MAQDPSAKAFVVPYARYLTLFSFMPFSQLHRTKGKGAKSDTASQDLATFIAACKEHVTTRVEKLEKKHRKDLKKATETAANKEQARAAADKEFATAKDAVRQHAHYAILLAFLYCNVHGPIVDWSADELLEVDIQTLLNTGDRSSNNLETAPMWDKHYEKKFDIIQLAVVMPGKTHEPLPLAIPALLLEPNPDLEESMRPPVLKKEEFPALLKLTRAWLDQRGNVFNKASDALAAIKKILSARSKEVSFVHVDGSTPGASKYVPFDQMPAVLGFTKDTKEPSAAQVPSGLDPIPKSKPDPKAKDGAKGKTAAAPAPVSVAAVSAPAAATTTTAPSPSAPGKRQSEQDGDADHGSDSGDEDNNDGDDGDDGNMCAAAERMEQDHGHASNGSMNSPSSSAAKRPLQQPHQQQQQQQHHHQQQQHADTQGSQSSHAGKRARVDHSADVPLLSAQFAVNSLRSVIRHLGEAIHQATKSGGPPTADEDARVIAALSAFCVTVHSICDDYKHAEPKQLQDLTRSITVEVECYMRIARLGTFTYYPGGNIPARFLEDIRALIDEIKDLIPLLLACDKVVTTIVEDTVSDEATFFGDISHIVRHEVRTEKLFIDDAFPYM